MKKRILISLMAACLSSSLYASDNGHYKRLKTTINDHPAYKISSSPSVSAVKQAREIKGDNFMPTQVFVIQGKTDRFYDCEDFLAYIDSFGFAKFFENNIHASYSISCPKPNDYRFKLKGYFEPFDDKGTVFAKQFLKTVEGSALFDTVFHFESAKAVVYNYTLELGSGVWRDFENFNQHLIRTVSLNFHSQREGLQVTRKEIEANLNLDEPEKILTLMKKYFFIDEGQSEYLLDKSNLVRLHRNMLFIYGDNLSKMMIDPDLSVGAFDVIIERKKNA